MKNCKRFGILVLCVVLMMVCVAVGFAGCNFDASARLNAIADSLAYSLFMGDDAFGWNVYFKDKGEMEVDTTWYSYSPVTEESIEGARSALQYYNQLLNTIKFSKLNSEKDKITYRSLRYALNTYLAYYQSPYAATFSLIGGSYISADGGFVADFSDVVENYAFRTEDDIRDLLSITNSTKDAFATYLDYARDRKNAGYHLFNYTVTAMQDYLNDVLQKGQSYYLYSFIDSKLDKATFLSQTAKQSYKADFETALTTKFMVGVRDLAQGLEAYKNPEEKTQKSYLASYGDAGKAYYQWLFQQKTGLMSADLWDVYVELYQKYTSYRTAMNGVKDTVDALQDTEPAVYEEFYKYVNGEKIFLDSSDPQVLLDYLKTAAKSIVPDLKNQPQIEFKYLDSTVEQITSTLAYYLRSPLDDENAVESITINGYQMTEDPSNLLATIAHEGYPGHLYAYVNAKESDLSLITHCNSCITFSEGWAMYVELALLNHIASGTQNKALKLYCQYNANEIIAGYVSSLLMDMNINYFGQTVAEYVADGYDEDTAVRIIEGYMEKPSIYVSYGYGMLVMIDVHDQARQQLGSAYNEVEFNGKLLSEGFGPTVERAYELANEYIASKK